MYKEPEAMKEIHAIRERMHEETKGFTAKEKIAYIRKAAQEARNKYGLKFKKRTKAHH